MRRTAGREPLTHYRTSPVPYQAYADEVRQRAATPPASRADQVFVATDEIEFLEFIRQEFGQRVIWLDDAPQSPCRTDRPIHLDRTLPVSNYQKGQSAIVDCLSSRPPSYLVKGRSNLSDASLAFNPELPYPFFPT